MRILTVVGARPQFIKAAPVSKVLRETGHHEFIVHTGQHYDYGMSRIFFEEMDIPEPDVNLEVGSGDHGWQTGRMLTGLEQILSHQAPDWVLVYGDTNSTLAGALAAAKLRIPLAHVEAGLRSYNREMPEEINRILTDHCADMLFCPTQTAVNNLAREGIENSVHLVGDTMFDATLQFADVARRSSNVLAKFGLQARDYVLVTLHRPYNTDNPDNLRNILEALSTLEHKVVFPVHPRTRSKLSASDWDAKNTNGNLMLVDPVGYLDMLMLEQHANLILTDSGGMQKEAFFFGVPCVTLRPETEWVETVDAGWNELAGADSRRILAAAQKDDWPTGSPPPLFGDGRAAQLIVSRLAEPLPNYIGKFRRVEN